MSLANNIRKRRNELGMTQEKLAELVGVTRSTVTQWETGWSQPRLGALERLADAFGCLPSELIEGKSPAPTPDGYIEVPLYGSIAAGTPIEMLPTDDMHPIPVIVRDKYPDAFLLKVRGESMNRVLPNGCYALIDPAKTVERDGKPYAVCVNGYDATIKRVRKLANGYELAPDSNDPTYRAQVYDYGIEGTDEITVIGRVVWYCVPFDWDF